MVMGWIWTAMTAAAILFGALNGKASAVSAAAMEGALAAVQLCLRIGGTLCLWSGVLELMRDSGLSQRLAGLLTPVLSRLFPKSSADAEIRTALAENVTSNLLGLGNAATPAGIRAVRGMQRLQGGEEATDEMCRFVVLNTASVQLIPTTVAAVRAAAGAENAFDILPAVWISSLVSVAVGLTAERLFRRKAGDAC